MMHSAPKTTPKIDSVEVGKTLRPELEKFLPPGYSVKDLVAGNISWSYAEGRYDPLPDSASKEQWNEWLNRRDDMDFNCAGLMSCLGDYVSGIKGPFLDVGPLYSPTFSGWIGDTDTKTLNVYLWDVDVNALHYNKERYPKRTPQFIDFNNLTDAYRESFQNWTRSLLKGCQKASFSAATLKQVLNYVDFRVPLSLIAEHQILGDLIFIANEINVGDAAYFHSNRPKSKGEVKAFLETLGYQIEEEKIIPGPTQGIASRIPAEYWPGEKFLLVGRKTV